ncbi:MAG: stage 0 sporulation protein [Anaerolineales bacterium]|nr:stage 0 sporulation protein [Anaerolineales bacterium]
MSDRVKTAFVISIRFQSFGKLYHFKAFGDHDVAIGDYVIVTTSRGREMGQVVGIDDEGKSSAVGQLKVIERRATPQDLVMRRMWQRRELEAMINCRAKASEMGLKSIKIAKAEFSFDGSRLAFLYSSEADEKVNVKKLSQTLQRSYRKSKVELRQIGPRDVAKIVGGMGACGLEERCCSRFLSEFSPISIRMAKAQGISLNPQEITGMCGRLRCCLMYEYEQYAEARKRLPKKNKRVVTPMGEGKVIEVIPLKNAVIVELNDGGGRAEFLKHELQPYEELKALQEKAKAPCKNHGGEDCDCGGGKENS